MDRLTENKIILVTRRTRLDDLIARFNTTAQARFYVEHLGADFSDYLAEHEQYCRARSKATALLSRVGRLQVLDRAFLPNFIFGPTDTVVVLGQDGLVANTVKYTHGQLILGVNPDPDRWDGVLLPFRVDQLQRVVREVFAGKRGIREVTMAKAELNTGQTQHAVNDLFIGIRSHASARYSIHIAGREEQHSSSGIIVSTGLGSTGWFRSLMAGAASIVGEVSEGRVQVEPKASFQWDADYLYYTVREPFPSKTSAASMVFGRVTARQPLTLISQMPESGAIFSDGVETDFLEFNSGAQAVIRPAERKGRLVM
jgi:NAD kinase